MLMLPNVFDNIACCVACRNRREGRRYDIREQVRHKRFVNFGSPVEVWLWSIAESRPVDGNGCE